MLNNPNEWHNIEEEINSDAGNGTTDIAYENSQSSFKDYIKYLKVGAAVFFVVLIAGLAIYKKINANKTQVDVSVQDPNKLAQSFYDKASNDSASGDTAIVNVDLGDKDTTTSASSQTTNVPVTVVPPLSTQKPNGDLVIETKAITPTDKYNYNNKALASSFGNKETVVVSIGNEGRENPFLPFKEEKVALPGKYSSADFDIIEPPTAVLPDPKAMQLMETTISGIMYDYRNPSAIVNINGQDQLVRKHDKLNGFTVLDITRDKVVIKSGTNIYRASVGQSITTEDVNFNDIANLNHKFAGSYRPVSKNAIVIRSN